MVCVNPVVRARREVTAPSNFHGCSAVYPIPHRVYEHMIRCHELRDCSYVVVIDASHELPEGLGGVHVGRAIRYAPIFSQRMAGRNAATQGPMSCPDESTDVVGRAS